MKTIKDTKIDYLEHRSNLESIINTSPYSNFEPETRTFIAATARGRIVTMICRTYDVTFTYYSKDMDKLYNAVVQMPDYYGDKFVVSRDDFNLNRMTDTLKEMVDFIFKAVDSVK